MSFGDAVKSFYKNSTSIKGRASRSEYWWAYLFLSLMFIPVFIISTVLTLVLPLLGMLVIWAYLLSHLLPFTTLLVRRLHDSGKSGLIALLYLVPIAGLLVFFFTLQESDKGENGYGPNPNAARDYVPMNVQGATQKFCSSCGSELRGDTGFCGSCGASASL